MAGNRTAQVTEVPMLPQFVPQELAFTDEDVESSPFPAKPILIAGAVAFALLAFGSLVSNRVIYGRTR